MTASQSLRRQAATDSTQRQASMKMHPHVNCPADLPSADTTNGMVAAPSTSSAIGKSASLLSSSASCHHSSYTGIKLEDRVRAKSRLPKVSAKGRDLQSRYQRAQNCSSWSLPSLGLADQNKPLLQATASSWRNRATATTTREQQIVEDSKLHQSQHRSLDWISSKDLVSHSNNHAQGPPSCATDPYSCSPSRQSDDGRSYHDDDFFTDSVQIHESIHVLRPFHPLQHPIDPKHRPTTSRGPASAHAGFGQVQIHDPSVTSCEHSYQSLDRQSAFLEGSMKASSRGVASSWLDIEPTSKSDSLFEKHEDCCTPRASASRDGSIDIREFKPSLSTPSKLKDTLLHFGRKSRLINDATVKGSSTSTTTSRPQKKSRRTLGHSWSTLNFLSEKLKSLGSSSNETKSDKNSNTMQVDQQTILIERKRKAEEAYATQFGFKKQKDNSGFATITSPIIERQRISTPSKLSADNATIRAYPRFHRRPVTSNGETHIFNGDPSLLVPPPQWTHTHTINQNERLKRPSRAELEKENRQLRALLRDATRNGPENVERPGSALSIHSNKSSIHLPLDAPTDLLEVVDLSRVSISDIASKSSNHLPLKTPSPSHSPKASKHRPRSSSSGSVKHRPRDVPPVPALPSKIPERSILAPVTGNVVRSAPAAHYDSTTRKSGKASSTFKLTRSDSTQGSQIQVTNKFKLKNSGKASGVFTQQQQHQRSFSNIPIGSRSTPVLLSSSHSGILEGDENMGPNLYADSTADIVYSSIPEPIKREEKWVWPDDVF